MNILAFLYLVAPLSINLQDKQYSHTENQCSFVYTVTKQWDLKLKAQGSFNLKFSSVDSRYNGKSVSDFLGTWEQRGDTIVMSFVSPSSGQGIIKNIKYLSSKKKLSAVGVRDYRLPLPLILEENKTGPDQQGVTIDTNDVAIVPFNTTMWWVFDSTYRASTLSNNEIELVGKLLQKCISERNAELRQDKQLRWAIDFAKRKYQKQYVVVVNEKGEKIVWVNGFCSPKERWRTEIVSVMDGGTCYFNLKINLTRMKCFDLMVNGVA